MGREIVSAVIDSSLYVLFELQMCFLDTQCWNGDYFLHLDGLLFHFHIKRYAFTVTILKHLCWVMDWKWGCSGNEGPMWAGSQAWEPNSQNSLGWGPYLVWRTSRILLLWMDSCDSFERRGGALHIKVPILCWGRNFTEDQGPSTYTTKIIPILYVCNKSTGLRHVICEIMWLQPLLLTCSFAFYPRACGLDNGFCLLWVRIYCLGVRSVVPEP
jgi:hypothetical protein